MPVLRFSAVVFMAWAVAFITPLSADTTAPPDSEQPIEVDTMPAPIHQVPPAYPESARKAGMQGTVYLKVFVDATGSVAKAKVDTGVEGCPELDQAALDAITLWTFKPAMKNGTPIAVWVTIPVKFKLDTCKDREKP